MRNEGSCNKIMEGFTNNTRESDVTLIADSSHKLIDSLGASIIVTKGKVSNRSLTRVERVSLLLTYNSNEIAEYDSSFQEVEESGLSKRTMLCANAKDCTTDVLSVKHDTIPSCDPVASFFFFSSLDRALRALPVCGVHLFDDRICFIRSVYVVSWYTM